jgi:hypothetical protein
VGFQILLAGFDSLAGRHSKFAPRSRNPTRLSNNASVGVWLTRGADYNGTRSWLDPLGTVETRFDSVLVKAGSIPDKCHLLSFP